MNREQFIRRLEEVGFNNNKLYSWNDIIIKVIGNKFLCVGNDKNILLDFDELEQFLIDKEIVKPEFDAEKYLIDNGMRYVSTHWHSSNNTLLKIWLGNEYLAIIGRDSYTHKWVFKGITKESCDKAIGLIKYLESIE